MSGDPPVIRPKAKIDMTRIRTQIMRHGRSDLIAVAVIVLFAAATVATALGADRRLLELTPPALAIAVLPLGWRASRVAPATVRRFMTLAVLAMTFQSTGLLMWFVAKRGVRPAAHPALGYWTPLLYLAVVAAAAAAWTIVRGVLRARDAALECSIIAAAAAAAAIGVAIANQHMGRSGWTIDAIDAMIRPLLSLLVVTLVMSALLGRGSSLPVSVMFLGAALLTTAAAQLWASCDAADGHTAGRGGRDLLWLGSSVLFLLAALAILSRRDRPLRLPRAAIPGANPAGLAVVIAAAWAATGFVLIHGLLTSSTVEITAGAAGVTWVSLAAVTRTASALHQTRGAYRALDEAHFALEQERERVEELIVERDAVIATLRERNVELSTTQIMLGPLLDLADERTDGRLRISLEETADDLASWLPLSPRRRQE